MPHLVTIVTSSFFSCEQDRENGLVILKVEKRKEQRGRGLCRAYE